MKWKRIPWEQPRLSREEKDPFLPQISEVDELINGAGWKLKVFLQLIWECGLRSIEANELLWEEVDKSAEPSESDREREAPQEP